MSKSKSGAGTKRDGLTIQIILSAVSILLGVLLLFVPQVQTTTLCYAFCGALIAAGVAAIVVFFVSEAYKNLHDYNFALGVVLLVLGCCGLLRVDDLAADFALYMGFTALILGVVILQSMVQMRVLQNKLWIVELILTIVSILGAVFVLADVKPVINAVEGFAYWVILIAGAASLISLLLSSIGIHRNVKKEEKAAEAANESLRDQAENP